MYSVESLQTSVFSTLLTKTILSESLKSTLSFKEKEIEKLLSIDVVGRARVGIKQDKS
jgi:hypothetical protein